MLLCWIVSFFTTQDEQRLWAQLHEAERTRWGANSTLDAKSAVELFRSTVDSAASSAAVQGAALFHLGELHEWGLGVFCDTDAAVKYFNNSARLGNASAQHKMAYLHATGVYGVPVNEGLAVIYDYFAALGGSAPAAMSLGYRYLYGRTVPQKCEIAQLYYELAANHGIDELAQGRFLSLNENTRLTDDMDTTKLKKGDDEIIQYYHYSADKGDTAAQVALGQLHYLGARGVTQNFKRAVEFFTSAYEQGQTGALGNIGHMYVQGLGVPQNLEEAYKHFFKGADMGQAAAQNGLGYMYANGLKVTENREKAMKFFKLAAEQGNIDALYNLGVMHLSGGKRTRAQEEPAFMSDDQDSNMQDTAEKQEFGERNFGKALQYFTLAAQNGHSKNSQTYTLALHKLALMNANGLGTAKSCSTAVRLFKTVAERSMRSSILHDALNHFLKGEEEIAVHMYEQAALEGFELAQSNGAWLESKVDGTSKRAVQLYQMAAEQGNVEANLKIGDFHYFGMGGLNVSYEKSAAHYRSASDMRHPQSMFNLGYMHQYGIGLPQDFHLAKRFYDMAATTHRQAYTPVALALANLWAQKMAKEKLDIYNWPGGLTEGGWGFLGHSLPKWKWAGQIWEQFVEFIRQATRLLNGHGNKRVSMDTSKTGTGISENVFELAPADQVLGLLTSLLIICLLIRARQMRRHDVT